MTSSKPIPSSDASAPRLNAIDVHVGRRVQQCRRQLGITREDLARALGVDAETMDSFETGRLRLGAAQLFALAGELSVPMAYFFDDLMPPSKLERDMIAKALRLPMGSR